MSFFNKKKVLVTGGMGFIGSHLAKTLLGLGAKVIILDLKSSNLILEGLRRRPLLVQGNILNLKLIQKIIKKYDVDLIFHLAAQALVGIANKNPLPTLKTNIEGTWNILEAARLLKVKGVVVASSDKAYGDQPVIPYKENMPLQGLHPYDASKSSADLLSQMYFKTYGLPVGVVRSANVFGGGDLHFSRIIPDTIRSAIFNKNPVIRSDGKLIRDYLYIEDEVSAFLVLAESLFKKKEVLGQAFNFSSRQPQKVLDVVNTILRLMKKSHLRPKILNQAQNEIARQSLDSSKAQKMLGWKPRYSFERGLKETIQWYTHYFKTKKS